MHFVKHSLILAMLAVLTGCGGGSSNSAPPTNNTPETPDNVTTVTSVSPQTAIIGQLTTFTLSGQKLSDSLQVSLPNCENITWINSPTTAAKFTCTPRAAGTQVLTVKTAAGATLFTSNINLQATAPAETVLVNSVEIPSKVTIGELATFTINGQNLSGTLQVILPQCQNLTPISITSTKIVFTCTPQVAGAQKLTIRDANGVTLDDTRTVTVQNPAPTLTGSWRQTLSKGCTGSVEGETIAGVRSTEPLFTFVRDSETQARLLTNEGFGYTTTDCTDTAQITTGVAKFAARYDNIGAVQQTSGLNYYYPVNTAYSNGSTATPSATAIVFKDTDHFCLFNGTVTPTNINAFIQNVNTDQGTAGCFARSSKTPFSQLAPAVLISTSNPVLVQRAEGELLLDVLGRLNQRGQEGIVLLHEAKLLRPEINATTNQTYDLLTQIAGFSGLKLTYQPLEEPAQGADFESRRLLQLNSQGAAGQFFLGKKQLDAVFGERTIYVKTNIPQTFTYQSRSDSDLNASKLASILDAQGATGCRFVDTRRQATPANTNATVCVKSNQRSSTFSYRYVTYPTSNRADALKTLLDTQKAEGFYPIRVLRVGADPTRILFERNSTSGDLVQSTEYKIYSQPLPTSQPELAAFLSDQGKLGWQLWSEINDGSGNYLATIFANRPFINLPDGESVVLNRN